MDARTEAADAGAAGAGLGDGRGKGLAARPPEGKHLSVDDGDGHGLGPPPRSRPREGGEDGEMHADAEGGRVAVAERHVITDYSGAAGAIAMPAERRSGSGGLTSIRQTGRTRGTGRKVDSRGIGNLQSFEGKIFPAIPWKISLE